MAQKYAPSSNNTLGYDELIVKDWSEDDFPQNRDGEIDIKEVATEIRRHYDHDNSARYEESLTLITDTEDNVSSAFDNAIGKLDQGFKKGCAKCSKQRRVTQVSSLKKGQHIKMPGNYFSTYIKPLRKSIEVYDHHAIVKKIESCKGTSVKMVLIHFSRADNKCSVLEETIEYDIGITDLYIIDYVFPKYGPDEIVERAKSIILQNDKFKTYNIASRNCEHFATWCVVGKGESFQVQSLKQKIGNAATGLFGPESRIKRCIFRLLFSSADEIAVGIGSALPGCYLTGGVALYLIYCIFMTANHFKHYRKGEICRSCLKDKLTDLWLTFGVFGLTSLISFLIVTFALPLLAPAVGIPLMILLVILAIAFQMTVPRLRKALGSPFSVDKEKVTSLSQIDIGDVISKAHCGVPHTCIVTKVKIENRKKTKGQIGIVHYGSSSLFGTRMITEEYFEADLEQSRISLLVCKPLDTFTPDVVVSRARSRIGESKWAMFSNRSCHFTFWAKVKQHDLDSYDNFDDILSEEKALPCSKASLFIREREIYRIDDLRIGDVVKSGLFGTGILKSVEYVNVQHSRKILLYVYTYSSFWRVTEKRYIIDLDEKRLFVNIYNPALCTTLQNRARNAQKINGTTGPWWTTAGFIRHCIEKR